MKRHPRDGLRDRWVKAIGAAEVGNALKALLLYLVATGRVTPRGALTFKHEIVAGELGLDKRRVHALMLAARKAGLLDRRGGGYVGRTTEYEITIPVHGGTSPRCTSDELEVHRHAGPFRVQDDVPLSSDREREGTSPPSTHYTRVTTETEKRSDEAAALAAPSAVVFKNTADGFLIYSAPPPGGATQPNRRSTA